MLKGSSAEQGASANISAASWALAGPRPARGEREAYPDSNDYICVPQVPTITFAAQHGLNLRIHLVDRWVD